MKYFLIKLIKILKHNLREVIFVFLAFSLMTAAAYFSVGHILRERLLDRAEEMISTAEANVRAGLFEAQTILLNAHHIVQNMIDQKASSQEILDYLVNTSEWMRLRDQGPLRYKGIYGYINGEFFDSINLNPGVDFLPQTRPWYQTAARSGASIGYTIPYIDWGTGESVVSAVRNIFDNNNRPIGILILDIDINWLVDYVDSLAIASGGYGILVNQNMTILAHTDKSFVGLQLQDLSASYSEIARILRGGGEVLAKRAAGKNKSIEIVFFARIFNGWYIGIVSPYHQFYKDLYTSAFILILIGLVLSLSLCSMLLRLSSAKMRADEENKSKSSFLASMSHEIRTPINAITGMAELLMRGDLSSTARSYVQDIKNAGNSLIAIINDILDFSKIEAGKMEIITAKYNLSLLLNEAIHIIRVRLAEKPIKLNINIDNNIPNSLIGDAVRLRQILLNLLSNAVKYTDAGEINLSVSIENKNEKRIRLKIKVSDTGKGIRAEDIKKLFDEFSRLDLKKNRGIEGTGLGLVIVKRLCDAMEGNIEVESEYGKGSSFTVIIPQIVESEKTFLDAHDLSSDIKQDTEEEYRVKFIIPDARILIVDDILANLTVAEGLLSFYLAKIDTCSSGGKAVELVKKIDYDLIFMDHMMPEMDGIEATTCIRAWEKEKNHGRKNENNTPIIMLTANAVLGMKEMYLEKGLNDFLGKPIDVSELEQIIKQWISKEKIIEVTPEDKEPARVITHNIYIPGVDVNKGIENSGGTLEIYLKVLTQLHIDIKERLPVIKTIPDAASIKNFYICIHSIKSAMATMGEKNLCEKASAMENAGKNGDMDYIKNHLSGFSDDLEKLLGYIGEVLKNQV